MASGTSSAVEPQVAAGDASVRELLAAALRHPASWCFAFVLLACAVYLAFAGYVQGLLIGLGSIAGTTVFTLLTLSLTKGAPAPAWFARAPATTRWRLWLQAAFLALWALLLVHWTLIGQLRMPRWFVRLPGWYPLLVWLYGTEQSLRIPPGFLVVPVIYLALPGAVLLLLGARPRELGLSHSYHAWRVALLWSAVPLGTALVNLAIGAMSPGFLLWRTLQTTMNSGPFEEFFFRGALMTRATRLLGTGWGIALSSFAFGLLHVATNAAGTAHGDLLAGAALAMLSQGAGGIGLAVVAHRTRSLLSSSAIHVVTNVGFG